MSTNAGRSLHWGLPGGFLAVLLLGVLLPAGALAAMVRQGETVTIGPDEVIGEDLYVIGRTLQIQGTVRGDLITASGRVEITGTVEGDVLSMAGDIRVSGLGGEHPGRRWRDRGHRPGGGGLRARWRGGPHRARRASGA